MDLIYPHERSLFRIAVVLATVIWLLLVVGTVGVALIYIGAFFLFAVFAQSGFISHLRGSGVRITPEQYPDLHARLVHCCQVTGVTTVPDMYLLRTDFFNAVATRFLRRHYVVLFTDVLDALEDRPGAINFYIGHELGHIHRNHIRWGWVLAPVLWLPLLGSAYRRAEEYTCDRYGNVCCDSTEDTVAAMAAIVAGNSRWPAFNAEAYLNQVSGTGGFWMSLNELTSEYPWLCKRLAWVMALRDGKQPELPSRNGFAWFLAAFVPSIPGGFASLLILIIFVGVIGAIALPAYNDYVIKANAAKEAAMSGAEIDTQVVDGSALVSLQFAEQLNPDNLERLRLELSEVTTQIEQYKATHGTWPASFSDIGFESEELYSDHGGMPVRIYEGGVVATWFGETESGGAFFVIEPVEATQGEITWSCYAQNIATELLPDTCR